MKIRINKTVCVLCLLTVSVLGGSGVFAQKKVKKAPVSEIKFVFKGIPDTMLYIATYYEDKTYMYDTLYVSKKEPYTFIMTKDTLPPRGIYLLASQNKVKYLDFVIDSSFSFTATVEHVDSQAVDLTTDIRFTGSPENEITLAFMRKMSHYQRFIITLGNEIKQAESEENPNQSLIDQYKEERREYQDSMRTFMFDYLDMYKNTLFGKAQLINREVQVPDPPRNADGSLVDSNFAFHYYINHYWDYIDLQEPALLSTPIFYPKLQYYFEKVIPPLVDSIIKYTDLLVEKAEGNPPMYRYLIWYTTSRYERSQYVAHDAVFVHMVKKYYATGRYTWADEAVRERMINKADKLGNILIGKKAPELYMPDTNGRFRSNYESKRKYTVIWFWDLNCGHCKSATPKLVDMYNRVHDSLDFEIYAVAMTKEKKKWKERIVEKQMPWINVIGNESNIDYRMVYDVTSTPVIFVLDKDKKIIVKKIGVDELENFIRDYDAGRIRY
ncbi:MAG: DUF5106 domain-containing protein [Bacteroidales bacterium]|nr:DUF5106 domain-containing protein [Bacteroidales bacterium]